ncbi:MAG: DUF4234 domain-containing protein [Oligoflexia bacterium]|nr:DUF4234 domain-containing protein [Oligoflexia bacterium]
MYTSQTQKERHRALERDIIINIIFSLITCGIYNIYWNYCEIESVNELIGHRQFSFWPWIIFSLLTCGIYHIYFEYKMGCAINDLQAKYNLRVDEYLPILSFVLTFFGLWIFTDAFQQHAINKVYVSRS